MSDLKQPLSARLGPRGAFPACFAFSIHKAGSTLMHRMISDVCSEQGIPCANLPYLLFHEGLADNEWSADSRLLPLFEDGRVYVGFRSLPQFFESGSLVAQRRSVLLVRDPRDALVSQYFSFGGKHVSHTLPEKNADKFLSRIKSSAHQEIDTYVLSQAKNYLRKMIAYQRALNFENVLLRRYEDIYFEKLRFLQDIFVHFGFDVPPPVLAKLAKRHDVRPAQERVNQHIRKGLPGDHVEKLTPETIARLNEIFAEPCRHFGYDLR